MKYLLLKAVELIDSAISREKLDLVTSRCSAPLRLLQLALLQGEGFAAGGWLPSKPVLCESALSGLLRKIEVDAIEALPRACSVRLEAAHGHYMEKNGGSALTWLRR